MIVGIILKIVTVGKQQDDQDLGKIWAYNLLIKRSWLNLYFFAFRRADWHLPHGHWDAIHFSHHGKLIPQPPPIESEHSSRLEWTWAPETGKEAYVLRPRPRRLGIWPEQNRKMTDLEAVCRSVACLWGIHSSVLPVHSFWSSRCQHGQTKPIYWRALFRLSYSFVRQCSEASESA